MCLVWLDREGRTVVAGAVFPENERVSFSGWRDGVCVVRVGAALGRVRRGIKKVVACRWWKSETSRDVGAHSETLAVGL